MSAHARMLTLTLIVQVIVKCINCGCCLDDRRCDDGWMVCLGWTVKVADLLRYADVAVVLVIIIIVCDRLCVCETRIQDMPEWAAFNQTINLLAVCSSADSRSKYIHTHTYSHMPQCTHNCIVCRIRVMRSRRSRHTHEHIESNTLLCAL